MRHRMHPEGVNPGMSNDAGDHKEYSAEGKAELNLSGQHAFRFSPAAFGAFCMRIVCHAAPSAGSGPFDTSG